jgi:predicted protein tyrosine phosphatase
MILVTSLADLPRALEAHRPSHAISLLGPEYMIDTPAPLTPERHLRVSVHDIPQPAPGMIAPSEEHVRDIVTFVDSWDASAPMLVHCFAGISRSTAAAFIGLCHLNPRGAEMRIARAIRAAAPHAHPNPRLVALADTYLGRKGEMIEAINRMGPGRFDTETFPYSLPLSNYGDQKED